MVKSAELTGHGNPNTTFDPYDHTPQSVPEAFSSREKREKRIWKVREVLGKAGDYLAGLMSGPKSMEDALAEEYSRQHRDAGATVGGKLKLQADLQAARQANRDPFGLDDTYLPPVLQHEAATTRRDRDERALQDPSNQPKPLPPRY